LLLFLAAATARFLSLFFSAVCSRAACAFAVCSFNRFPKQTAKGEAADSEKKRKTERNRA